ncbi:MAG: hypothetical protein HQK89_15950, partial [Nitrospirae bacterium]|nr:hypothetical protein [Nitrospirota bacterium]
AKSQLSALSLWKGSLEEVSGIALPSLETVERFSRLLQAIEKELQQVNVKKNGASERIEKLTEELIKLESGGAVPTIGELNNIRNERNKIWKRIRTAWIESTPIDEIMPEKLATEYERAIGNADESADRLWREAERVAKYSTLGAEKEQRGEELAGYDSKIEQLTANDHSIMAQWQAQWQPAAIMPLPPAEMKSWLYKHAKLVELVDGWKERLRAKDVVVDEIKRYFELCTAELAGICEPGDEKDETLSGLLIRAEEIIATLQDKEKKRSDLSRDIDKSDYQMRNHFAERERLGNALNKWKNVWGKAVSGVGFDENASSEEVEAILVGLSRLFQKVNDIRKDQIRIDQIDEDARRFSDKVSELAGKYPSDLYGLPSEKAAFELIRRFDNGKENQKAAKTLVNRLRDIRRELAGIGRDLESAAIVLEKLMERAGCSNPEDLEEAEKRSTQYRELSMKLADIEDRMLDEGVSMEELVRQAESIPPDMLSGEIQKAENKESEIKEQRDRLQVAIGSIQKDLEDMDGNSHAAADAAAEAQEALASIRDNTERYVRWKLAVLLLDKEIERYRQDNQGPILKRAGEMFRCITLGAYAELTTDFNASDQPILLCMRNNGNRVPVEGLSDGTRDQLYLALRLASLEQHVERNKPLPLIIDDVLINFDDQRALATLKLLSETSGKTQILFFTHHMKLIELARSAVPSNLLKEHFL